MNALKESLQHRTNELIVVKYGGNAMTDTSLQQAFAQDMAFLHACGLKVVVVHGGGPQVDEWLTAINHSSERIDGMRVTDATTMKVAEMVLGGLVNGEIVNLINQAGAKAVGLNGKDGKLIDAIKLVSDHDLGFVGQIRTVDTHLIYTLLDAGYIPVIAPIASDELGTNYNINADIVAGAIAKALNADELLLLTNIHGVLDSSGNLINQLSQHDIQNLIADGTIYGGMIPKLSGAMDAIDAGLSSVTILNGMTPHSCVECLAGKAIGTQIVRG